MARLKSCRCDYCLYPLVVGSAWRWPLQRDLRMPKFYAFQRRALACAITPPNLFDFAQIRSGNVDAAGGHVEWAWHRRDYARFLDSYGLGDTYREGGMHTVLRQIGLTRMQAEAFGFVVGMELSQTRTADLLGITQGAVSLRLAGARDRIRQWREKGRGRNLIVLHLVRPIDERHTTTSFFLPAS